MDALSGRIIQRRTRPDHGRDGLARVLYGFGFIGGRDFFVDAAVRIEPDNFWVDIVFPRERAVVEIDGTGHLARNIQAEDQKRNERFVLHGWRVIRLQRAKVINDPDRCAWLILDEINARIR